MNLRLKIGRHLKENRLAYAFLTLIFLLGIFLGYQKVYSLEGEVRQHLSSLINDYLLGGYKGDLSSSYIFMSVYLGQLKSLVLIWFLGLTVIGIPLILGVILVRGFSLGFTVGFLVQEKAGAGVLVSILSILPQNLVYFPLIIVWALIAINFSVYIVKGREGGGLPLAKGLLRYFLLLIVCVLVMLVGVLIETYLVPWLLSWFL